jgi:glycosyltransferase involved in cell wall biosynthesis
VPLGVDVERFTPAPRAQTRPSELLFVGRLRYYKGLDTLLHALVDLPGVHLTVVGTGPMQVPWKALAHELGLIGRVTFAGEVDDADLPACYRHSDLFVLPANARSEAFGMVLLEAMASGLPCITTEVGTGTSWIVQDGKTGLVVPPQDPSALAVAIDRLVRDPALYQAMAEAGRARVEEVFSHERMVQGVEAVYRDVLL